MKAIHHYTLYWTIPLSLVVLGFAAPVPAADGEPGMHHHGTVYEITPLPSLGGTFSAGNAINARGWVAGFSDLEDNELREAVLWKHGEAIGLGTLGGPHSSVAWPGLNHRGTVVGVSETTVSDPTGPGWSCAFFFPSDGSQACRGFAWQNGEMRPMPTLGDIAENSYATAVNNRNQVVGWAETDFEDPTCDPESGQMFQFLGVVWNPRTDEMQVLPPLDPENHSVTAAVTINDRGQVAGISGICDQAVGRDSALAAVMWDRGEIIDLGTLGGPNWHTPTNINERGDVVGFSTTGEGAIHAFLWTRSGGIEDLGVLDEEHFQSQAAAINERRQVVGLSVAPEVGSVAFIWQNGEMTDLNSLTPDDFTDHLATAAYIDNRGRITGRAVDAETGESYAYIATPKRRPW